MCAKATPVKPATSSKKPAAVVKPAAAPSSATTPGIDAPAAPTPVVAPVIAHVIPAVDPVVVDRPTATVPPVVAPVVIPVVAPVVAPAAEVKPVPTPSKPKVKQIEQPDPVALRKAAFDALVSDKMRAGLPRPESEEVAERQLRHDEAIAAQEAAAAKE